MLLLENALIVSAFMYSGTLFALGFQLFNSMSSPRFMDGAILLFTFSLGFACVSTLAADLLHRNDGFDPGHAVPSFVMLSAIALIQSRRK